MEHLNTAP